MPTSTTTEDPLTMLESPSYGPAADQTLTQYSNELGMAAAGLNESERKRVENLINGFYDDLLENDSDRRTVLLQSADDLCAFDQEFNKEINASMLAEGGDTTGKAVRRAHYAAQIVNKFEGDVPVKPLAALLKPSDGYRFDRLC